MRQDTISAQELAEQIRIAAASVVLEKHGVIVGEELIKKEIERYNLRIGIWQLMLRDWRRKWLYKLRSALMHTTTREILKKNCFLGNLSLNRKDYKQAEKYFGDALLLHEILKQKEGIAEDLYELAIVYEEQQRYNKAKRFYKSCLNIYEQLAAHDKTAKLAEKIQKLESLYNIESS